MPSGSCELSHHAVVLMLKNMAVVHEGCFHGRLGEPHQKLNGLAHQHRVPHARVARNGLASIPAEHLKLHPVDMKGMGHHLP